MLGSEPSTHWPSTTRTEQQALARAVPLLTRLDDSSDASRAPFCAPSYGTTIVKA